MLFLWSRWVCWGMFSCGILGNLRSYDGNWNEKKSAVIPCWSRCTKKANRTFACLVRMIFTWRQRVKDLLLRARVVVRTSNIKIPRRRLADYVKHLHQKVCRTCSTIIFLHSTNPIIDLWRCYWRCRRQILNSLLFRLAVFVCVLFITL